MPTTLDYDELSTRLGAGGRLTDADVDVLASTNDLVLLGMLADEARVRQRGRRVTYVRVHQVPLNGSVPDRIPRAAREVRITGAIDDLDATVAFIRGVAGASAGVPVSGLSLADVEERFDCRYEAMSAWLARCREAGLEFIASAPIDALKDPSRAFDAAAGAGIRAVRLTLDSADPAETVELLRRAGALQNAIGTFGVLAPLPVVAGPAATGPAEAGHYAEPGGGSHGPSTGYDDVKRVALARLIAANIPSIQVDWSAYGPKLAQVALTFGADDLDAVTPFDTIELGPRRAALEEVRRNIEAAALEPVERNGRYELVEDAALRGQSST